MRSKWKECRLGDITDWFSGGTPPIGKAEFWNGEIPWISASSMQGIRFEVSDRTITPLGLQKSRLAEKGTILLLVRGSILHQRIPVGMATRDVAFNQDVKAIKVNDGVNSKYILYWLIGNENSLLQMVSFTGIGAGKLETTQLQNLEVKLPSKEIQDRIVDVIEKYDDKIALNTQINQTLEAMAQALFKSWFVNFDPVKAKMEARANGGDDNAVRRAAMAVISGKSADELQQFEQNNPESFAKLAETADLFPERLVESEPGEIPEGWEVIRLDSIVTKISKGTTPRKEDLSNAPDCCNIPFLKVKDIADSGEIDRMNLELIPLSVSNGVLKRSVLELNDILVSIAGTIGRVAIVEDDLQGANCNQAVAFVRLREPNKYLEYCRQVLRSSAVQNAILSKVVQGVQANFSLSGLSELKIIKPINSILEAFNLFAVKAFKKQRLLSYEYRQLAAIRDTLLPKLLSGEIDLSSFGDRE